MASQYARRIKRLRHQLRTTLAGPHALAFLPAIVLGAFWIGGETWLLGVSLGLPLIYALVGGFDQTGSTGSINRADDVQDVPLDRLLDDVLTECAQKSRTTASFLLTLDDFDELVDRYGQAAAQTVITRTADRLVGALRSGDRILTMERGLFAVVLAPVRHLDLEVAIQLSGRLQQAVEEPISMDSTTVFMSCSVGFCTASRNPGNGGTDLLAATQAALNEACNNAPSAIRAYAEGMQCESDTRSVLADEAAIALEDGQIRPWYQPQISTDTGLVTGFEALARWVHPERGVISPAEFLPVLEDSGQMERLGEVMLNHAMTALNDWDKAGVTVPQVGVNFASQELRNPKLVEKIRWELDRFDIAAERLSVEVLETVVAASPDDTISRSINGLAKLGCHIDLDDFGTGHASISSIRRFAVGRIKIDRSFVMKVDRDPEQQRMVAAILTMAERLDLDTLAEGVETVGEHAMLAQLGCGHVQGFGIARPMPLEQTFDWIRAHNAKLEDAPKISRTGD